MEAGEEIKQQREDDAEEKTGGQREIEGDAAAAVGDVAGETAEGKAEAGGEEQNGSGKGEKKSESEEGFAESGHAMSLDAG